jgi:DNA replication protein DnaC
MSVQSIKSEVKRWLGIYGGQVSQDDKDTWDFYNDDIRTAVVDILDETEREKTLIEVRKVLNLHKQPMPFCASCNDAGWVFWTDRQGYQMASKCPVCHGVPDASVLFRQAGVPLLFKKYTRFNVYDEAPLVAAKRRVDKFIRNYKAGKGLLLMGSVGVGKTHLAVGIIKCLCEQKVRCKFWDINEWLDQLRDSYNEDPEESRSLLEHVKCVDFLVLDDLGAQRITDHTTDRLFDVINARYLAKLSTVITTNITKSQISATYGERVWSRLFAMCDVIPIETQDHRLRSKE